MSPGSAATSDKAPHLTIDAARAAGLPIRCAGKREEPGERACFAEHIEPRLGAFSVAPVRSRPDAE